MLRRCRQLPLALGSPADDALGRKLAQQAGDLGRVHVADVAGDLARALLPTLKRLDHLLAPLPARRTAAGAALVRSRPARTRTGRPAATATHRSGRTAGQRLKRLHQLIALRLDLLETLADALLHTIYGSGHNREINTAK